MPLATLSSCSRGFYETHILNGFPLDMPVQPDTPAQEESPVQNIPVPPSSQNVKSSDEILSELFGAFNATPPPLAVIKQEKESSDTSSKRNKKHSKKKHKKVKKRKHSSSSESSESEKIRKVSKKIKKEKNSSKSVSKSDVDRKQKKRKFGKFSASDSDSEDEGKSKRKKKSHSDDKNNRPSRRVKTEPVSSKLPTSCVISSMKETILKEAVGKIVDNVIDSTKLLSSILPQPPVQVKVEPRSDSNPVIKQEPRSPSAKPNKRFKEERTQNIPVPSTPSAKDIPVAVADVMTEDIPIPGELSTDVPNHDAIPIPKGKIEHSDQPDGVLPVADVFVEDLLDSGINAEEFASKKEIRPGGGKITIQNLKFSQVYEQAVKQVEEEAKRKAEKYEEGELSDSSEEPTIRSPTPSGVSSAEVDEPFVKEKEEIEVPVISKTKKHRHHHKREKHRHRDRSHDRKRSTSKENHRSRPHRVRSLSRDRRRHRDRIRSRSRDLRRSRSRDRRRSRSRERKSSRSRERKKSRSRERRSRDRSKSRDRRKSRERSKSKERSGEKTKSRDRKRDETNRKDDKSKDHRNKEDKIDKRKLLEIARKNALNMLKSATPGVVPEQTKVSLTAGGKTVNELTDFCKLLSKKDADGHESISSNTSHSSDEESERAFHHPFQLRDRPNSIVLNIRNSVALPTRSHQEKTAEQSRQLRLQFPVSSGQQHRSTENEWYPVSPKKAEPSTSSSAVANTLVAVRPARPRRVFKDTPDPPSLDIGSIVSQRLNAIRKLQENPKDNEALSLMSSAQHHMQTWAESKQDPPGTFTGSTGVKVLTQAELSSGYQAWARKDQLQTAAPLTGGMGMALLQKMGWRPGEGLGKHKEGTLQPLMLSVKTDKKGLVAQEELPARQPHQIVRGPPRIRTLEGKHPVSLLNEYCSRRRFGPPVFELVDEVGPDHKKYFLFKVKVSGVEYKPAVGSPKKKQARAEAAEACLKAMGVLPK